MDVTVVTSLLILVGLSHGAENRRSLPRRGGNFYAGGLEHWNSLNRLSFPV